MAPVFLQTYQPDQVIVMNPIYREEIQHMLTDIGVSPEIITL